MPTNATWATSSTLPTLSSLRRRSRVACPASPRAQSVFRLAEFPRTAWQDCRKPRSRPRGASRGVADGQGIPRAARHLYSKMSSRPTTAPFSRNCLRMSSMPPKATNRALSSSSPASNRAMPPATSSPPPGIRFRTGKALGSVPHSRQCGVGREGARDGRCGRPYGVVLARKPVGACEFFGHGS